MSATNEQGLSVARIEGWLSRNPEGGREPIHPDDLRTLLSALRQRDEDAERLDWLDRVNAATNEHNGTTYGWRYDINHNRAALTDHNHPALTVRDAIDVARGVKTATEAAGTSREARAILTESETNAR